MLESTLHWFLKTKCWKSRICHVLGAKFCCMATLCICNCLSTTPHSNTHTHTHTYQLSSHCTLQSTASQEMLAKHKLSAVSLTLIRLLWLRLFVVSQLLILSPLIHLWFSSSPRNSFSVPTKVGENGQRWGGWGKRGQGRENKKLTLSGSIRGRPSRPRDWQRWERM